HAPSGFRGVEGIKNALNGRTFRKARKLITWNHWGKNSLIRDYGVSGSKVIVVPPGVDMVRWNFNREARANGRRLGRLFVGGEFQRKGGEVLLRAFRDSLAADCELDIVTRDAVVTDGLSHVRVHHGLGPNAPGLMALYEQADLFVFPTFGDVLPIAIMEAMAS